jgi:phosphonate transport system substrate-binding protein
MPSALYRFQLFFSFISVFFLVFQATLQLSCANPEHEIQKTKSQTVNLGIITLYHPLVMYRNYQPFIDYLTENTHHTFMLKISENYYQIIDYLSKGTVEAAILGGMTYIEAKKKVEIVPLLAALGKDGNPTCHGVFITRSDNNQINILNDIKGKRFAFASIHSTSGNLMPLHHLYANSNIKLSDFNTHVNLKYHDAVIREVLRGNYDAGAALETIASQYEDVGLKFIDRTEPFPGFVLVVRKDASSEIVESIKTALLALNYKNTAHQKIMNQWDVNIRYGFTPTSDDVYKKIQEAVTFLSSQGIEWR